MNYALPIAAALIAVSTGAAFAKDRPLTDQERPKLEAALKEAGCSGGKMEFDDDKVPPIPMASSKSTMRPARTARSMI